MNTENKSIVLPEILDGFDQQAYEKQLVEKMKTVLAKSYTQTKREAKIIRFRPKQY